MAILGTDNMSAFLRKMAIDGQIIKLELPELKQITSLLRYTSNNINQIAHRINETESIYKADIDEVKNQMDELWKVQKYMLSKQPYSKQ